MHRLYRFGDLSSKHWVLGGGGAGSAAAQTLLKRQKSNRTTVGCWKSVKAFSAPPPLFVYHGFFRRLISAPETFFACWVCLMSVHLAGTADRAWGEHLRGRQMHQGGHSRLAIS